MAEVAVLTPVYFGHGTGAASYYKILAHELHQRGKRALVISERAPGESAGGEIDYVGLLPRRTSVAKRRFAAPAAYAWQNLAYLKLPAIISQWQPETLLVHSSFYNHPGLFERVMRRLRKGYQGRMILDVRDPLLPPDKAAAILGDYDETIACSENIRNFLQEIAPRAPITHIPVPQESLDVPTASIPETLAKFGLTKPFLLYVGMVKELKAVDLLLKAFNEHFKHEVPEVELVVAGILKTEGTEITEGLKQDRVRYLGPVARDEAVALMAASRLSVTLSRNEGMPRASLEALAMGVPVALPPCVPEFVTSCPEWVVSDQDPGKVANRLIEVMAKPPPQYPLENHKLELIIPQYLRTLTGNASPPEQREA